MDEQPVDMRFVEIEHKYVVPEDFDVAAFAGRVRALGPEREKTVRTRDIYYLTGIDGYIFRHRRDRELQHLTLKSYGGDTRTRVEVNLELLQGPDQADAVAAFLAPLGIARQVTIAKETQVFEFHDCEVVHYVARSGERTICCVEIEALGQETEDAAVAVIERYREALGLGDTERSEHNLLDLMLGA